MDREFHERVERMVQQNVHYCVSNLIGELASTYGTAPASEYGNIHEQAFELACPIEDWESAAQEAGWNFHRFFWYDATAFPSATGGQAAYDSGKIYDSARDVCEALDLEPHEREVYEHWIVSDWLARELEKRGEKVDHDFAGLTIWARTTTGQAISMDSVIEDIRRELDALVAA